MGTCVDKGSLKECHVTTNDVIVTKSCWTHDQMIINECAKFKVIIINNNNYTFILRSFHTINDQKRITTTKL